MLSPVHSIAYRSPLPPAEPWLAEASRNHQLLTIIYYEHVILNKSSEFM